MVILFSFLNNIVGGEFMDVFSLWKIGRFISEKKNSCGNIHKECSNFLSYYYGNSYRFSLLHIQLMERFYSYFPIFVDCMNNIQWNSYIPLLLLNQKECYFYYRILLFCGDDSHELFRLIHSDLYSRI